MSGVSLGAYHGNAHTYSTANLESRAEALESFAVPDPKDNASSPTQLATQITTVGGNNWQ